MTIEADVAAHIRSALAGPPHDLTANNCRAGAPRKVSESQTVTGAVPARCVFVLSTGGQSSIPFIDGGAKTKDERPSVQVTIRSNPKDYSGGKSLADAVFSALDMNPPPGFYEARATDSEPAYLREDEQNHHMWSINVALRRC